MIVKALAHMLLAASMVHFFPIDGAALELQAGVPVPPDTVLQGLQAGPVPVLPQARDKAIPPPTKVDVASFGVVTSAESVTVVDAASGASLFVKNPDEVRPIGSISKLMSALVFLDTGPNLRQMVSIKDTDYAGTGHVYLDYNVPVRLENVLGASLVGSDNTATLALARLSGLSTEDFVARMNAKASELGLAHTHFEDPTGLSAHNVSTASELVVLLSTAEHYDVIDRFMTTATLTLTESNGKAVNIPSTDQLLTSNLNKGAYKITAGKTGYIPQAGYCLATAVTHEGHEMYIVVLGAHALDARFDDALDLAGWAYKTFAWPGTTTSDTAL